ncbi:MAG TPA: hypothetical protein VK463_03090 [Desulfomonilaceae bacterium]|nr:hypothetical protein [Desulfomonilaceae bacterium]
MVARILCPVLCLVLLIFITSVVPANASYCGPAGCPPQGLPMCGPAPVCPPPQCGPAPMACMPNCLPPCPAPGYAPPSRCGFNPLSAILSVITFPFKLIAGAVKRPDCQPPMFCPPPGCMPMCAPPVTKCKPGHQAAYRGPAPMLNPMVQ